MPRIVPTIGWMSRSPRPIVITADGVRRSFPSGQGASGPARGRLFALVNRLVQSVAVIVSRFALALAAVSLTAGCSVTVAGTPSAEGAATSAAADAPAGA